MPARVRRDHATPAGEGFRRAPPGARVGADPMQQEQRLALAELVAMQLNAVDAEG